MTKPTQDPDEPADSARRKGRGFFALDVHQFYRIQSLGLGLEEAAAYLCLLVSTDQTNVTSTGGINSIATYSGLSRAEAKRAVTRLQDCGLIQGHEVARKRARTVPRYSLPIHDPRSPLGLQERQVVDAIAGGRQPQGKPEANAAQRAQTKGYIERRSDGWAVVEHANEVAFIPNNFVRTSKGVSPLGRLVNHGELGPLMLAAELYKLQDLMEERGVPASALRSYFHSKDFGKIGRHRVHLLKAGRQFKPKGAKEPKIFNEACDPKRFRDYDQQRFWASLEILEAAHVIEWAVYSANGKPSGEYGFNRPQRPLGVIRNGRQVLAAPESIAAFAVYLLLIHMNGEAATDPTRTLSQLIADWQRRSFIIALENRSVAHVEGVGILRLTHRAVTENSRVWLREAAEECRQVLFLAETIAQEECPQALDIIQELKGMRQLGVDDSMKIND